VVGLTINLRRAVLAGLVVLSLDLDIWRPIVAGFISFLVAA
jgi:hypothetical protein